MVVGFLEAGSEKAQFLEEFAEQYRDEFSFGMVQSLEVAGDHSMGTIVMFKPYDDLENVYEGPEVHDTLHEFLVTNSMRAVDEIGPTNYQKYVSKGLPICWLFTDGAKETQVMSTNLLQVYHAVHAVSWMVPCRKSDSTPPPPPPCNLPPLAIPPRRQAVTSMFFW